MAKITKAIVLAAGFGTRLRPFTTVTPKPLLPIWGEPVLDRILQSLRERGVTDFVLNAHHLSEQIEEYVAAIKKEAAETGVDLKISVSREEEILGTGGVLNPLRDWIGDEPFYLVNGDIVVEGIPPLEVFPGASLDKEEVLGVALVTEEGPRTIEVEPESGYVTNWRSEDAGFSGTYTYCGYSILKPAILDYVEKLGFSSIVTAYEKAMMEGKFLKAVTDEELLWTDAGSIETYLDLNQDGEENGFAAFPQIAALLKAAGLSLDSKIKFLGARGSNRVFFKGDAGIFILYDDLTREENALYAAHARYLKAKGIKVPEVKADLPEMKATLYSWAGEERKMSLEEYVKVVEHLVKFNQLGSEADLKALKLTPAFDAALWKWERDLFEKYCLQTRFGREMPDAVRAEFEQVAQLLEREPKALVHRDFQATNVLWQGDQPTFIDFQGMRLGPAAYDLASLVYDPYVEFTEGERRALVALYARKAGREELVKVLPYAAVQRLSQCLGAYGRLASVGQPQFGKFVLPALEHLLDAADHAGLDAIGALAEELIAEEMKRRGNAAGAESHCSCGHHHEPGHECHCHHHHH